MPSFSGAIRRLGSNREVDPLTDPEVLERSVTMGLMDAPQLKNNPFGRGLVRTRIVDGACEAVDEQNELLIESSRLAKLLKE